MPDNKISTPGQAIELKISIYKALRDGKFGEAEELALSGIEEDIHNTDYENILKIIKFWQNRKELFDFKENNAEILIEEWDKFLSFCRENRLDCRKAVLSLKDFVFSKIVDLLIDSYRLSPVPERETLILLGQSFYEIGLIDKAIETLEYAMSINQDDEDVRIYTLLGNLYTETNDNDLAMVMYNEAFLKFPQLINLESIDFPSVLKLKEMVLADGFKDNELPEWIPVYGYLYDGLTVKKKLEYKDFIDLREKIIDYEKSLKIDKKVLHIVIPRLINYYLWALDYYLFQANAVGPAEDVVKRILDLLNTLPADAEIKKKLRNRAELLFKKLLENKLSLKKELIKMDRNQ